MSTMTRPSAAPASAERAPWLYNVESRLSMNFLNLISYFPQYSRTTSSELDIASLTR
jgi:hypothetical protein